MKLHKILPGSPALVRKIGGDVWYPYTTKGKTVFAEQVKEFAEILDEYAKKSPVVKIPVMENGEKKNEIFMTDVYLHVTDGKKYEMLIPREYVEEYVNIDEEA